MDYVTIALLGAILVIGIIILAVLLKNKKNDGSEELDSRFEMLKSEITQIERESRRELSESINNSIKMLSGILSDNQKTMSEATVSQLKQLEERFKTLETTNEQKLNDMRETISKRLATIQDDNNKKLDEIRHTVDEKLQKTLDEKMTESFKRVSDDLQKVYEGLGEMKNIATDVGGLKKVLSNVKTRGILGEIQLGAILREILAPEQYETDIATVPGSANRVEFAVKLPGDNGTSIYLPIDSKFPSDAYENLRDAYDAGDKEGINVAFNVLSSRIKSFAKDIHDKYIEPPYTTNFAIMFLPFEGLYSEVVNRGLVEVLQKEYNISIAGPSTMAALLNSLQMGFKTLAIQKRSSEVWQILGAVKSEFGKFELVLDNAQKKLNLASDELEKLRGVRTRAISRKLREVESLDDKKAAALLEVDSDIEDLS